MCLHTHETCVAHCWFYSREAAHGLRQAPPLKSMQGKRCMEARAGIKHFLHWPSECAKPVTASSPPLDHGAGFEMLEVLNHFIAGVLDYFLLLQPL